MATEEEKRKHIESVPVYELTIKVYQQDTPITKYFTQKEYDLFSKTHIVKALG